MSVIPITTSLVFAGHAANAPSPTIGDVNRLYVNGWLDKIQAIRFLRTYTGMGLRDAKDTVESAPPSWAGIKSLLAPIFEAYGKNIFSDSVDSASEENPNLVPNLEKYYVTASTAILKGVATALESWRQLGFKTPFEACRIVIDNLEKTPLSQIRIIESEPDPQQSDQQSSLRPPE
jgi:hypothetical protein